MLEASADGATVSTQKGYVPISDLAVLTKARNERTHDYAPDDVQNGELIPAGTVVVKTAKQMEQLVEQLFRRKDVKHAIDTEVKEKNLHARSSFKKLREGKGRLNSRDFISAF